MQCLIGKTGYSFFDYWTLAHLSFWFLYGSTVAAVRLNRGLFVIAGLSVAFSWEVFERLAERKWPEIWASPESWWNAWISDPLTVLVGVGIAFYGYDTWRR